MGIPWRNGEASFDDNYETALSRLKMQEKSLLKKAPKISDAYNQGFKAYRKKGYITKVHLTEEIQWFLPHHLVIREDKKTTKVSIVFGAAGIYNGKA